jgi:hypothetical protein
MKKVIAGIAWLAFGILYTPVSPYTPAVGTTLHAARYMYNATTGKRKKEASEIKTFARQIKRVFKCGNQEPRKHIYIESSNRFFCSWNSSLVISPFSIKSPSILILSKASLDELGAKLVGWVFFGLSKLFRKPSIIS